MMLQMYGNESTFTGLKEGPDGVSCLYTARNVACRLNANCGIYRLDASVSLSCNKACMLALSSCVKSVKIKLDST